MSGAKHTETRFHFLRDQLNKEKLELQYCKIDLKLAGLLTKPSNISTFEDLKRRLDMVFTTNLN